MKIDPAEFCPGHEMECTIFHMGEEQIMRMVVEGDANWFVFSHEGWGYVEGSARLEAVYQATLQHNNTSH